MYQAGLHCMQQVAGHPTADPMVNSKTGNVKLTLASVLETTWCNSKLMQHAKEEEERLYQI